MKKNKQKGMTLTEVVVAMSLVVIIAATVTTVLVSGVRLTDKAIEKMGTDSMICSIEKCSLSKSPVSALSFYLGEELGESVTELYYDENVQRVEREDESKFTLTVDNSSGNMKITLSTAEDGEIIYSTELQTSE